MAGRKPSQAADSSTPVPERIGDHHITGAHRAEEPGHAERRVGAQLHGIAKIIIQAAQDGVHAFQSRERLQIDACRRGR